MRTPLQQVVFWSLVTILAAGSPCAAAAQGKPGRFVALHSNHLTPKVPMRESAQGVSVFYLSANVDDKGEGKGTLVLDPNTPMFNEFGDVVGSTLIAAGKFECALEFVKKGKVRGGRPGLEEDWLLYRVKGPKLTSDVFLAVPTKEFRHGRLLIQEGGKVKYVVPLREQDRQPCHPGCFPAGTPVNTPRGPRPIDGIKVGDLVTSIRPDGQAVPLAVTSVFVTRNRLVKVEIEGQVLLTTETQPLCLADGRTKPAGELKAGDRILRREGGKLRAVPVVGVALTDREDQVFNLVLGDSEIFVAQGFLVRSKPPADVALSSGTTPPRGPALPSGRR